MHISLCVSNCSEPVPVCEHRLHVGALVWCCVTMRSYLTNGDGQGLNNLLVCHSNNALTVNFNDPVSDANAAALSNTSTHQTADLKPSRTEGQCATFTTNAFCSTTGFTYDAVLNTEAELKLEVGSFDEDCGDGRAAHDTQLYLHLIL